MPVSTEGTEYCFGIESWPSRSGAVFRKPGDLVWRYRYQRSAKRVREWVFLDPTDECVFHMRRVSHVPSRFELLDESLFVGRITVRGLLRNRFDIDLEKGPCWRLHFPLFTIRCQGSSSEGRKLLGVVGSSLQQWYALIEIGSDEPRLLCALAFIFQWRWDHA